MSEVQYEQDFCQISSYFNEQIFKLLLFVYIAYENNQKKPRTLTCLSIACLTLVWVLRSCQTLQK